MRIATVAVAAVLGSTVFAAGVALSAAASAQVHDYPTYADVGLVWTRSPSVRDMVRFYRTTRHDGLRGTAQVLCTSDAEGRLDCSILDEAPADREFGLAGVRVMERARVATRDGSSPAGRQFAYRLRFGNWPASQLPDSFQPISQNLVWVDRPTLVGVWNMSGQDRGNRIAATIDCVAQADGTLANCQIVSADSPAFGEAALTSMARARVQRADSGRLAGSPLRWTLAVERQSGCGAASGGSGRSGSYPAMSTGASLEAGIDPVSAFDYASSSTQVGGDVRTTGGGMPGCQSAMIQVQDGE